MPNRSSIVKRNLYLPQKNVGPYYYTTNPVWPYEEDEPVTVGVGAVCDSGDCIILGSDTRGSYPKNAKLSPNDWTGKVYDKLPHGFFAGIAGTVHACHAVSSQFAVEMGKLTGAFKVDEVRFAINEARFYERNIVAGDRLYARFGLSLHQWQTLPTDSTVLKKGEALIKRIPVPMAMIVAGFMPWKAEDIPNGATAAVLFMAFRTQPVQMENNFTTIGSGGRKAQDILDYRGQNIHRSWQRTAIDVLHAMRAAHKQNKRHVGMPDDLIVIRNGSFKRFPVNATYVKNLLAKTGHAKVGDLRKHQVFIPEVDAILESLLFDQPNAP
jgi:hypothetical protein